MDCAQLIQYLSDYIDNQLDEKLAEAARAHLSTCHNCAVVLDSTKKTILLYRENRSREQIPADRGRALFGRLVLALASAPAADEE